MQTNLKALFSGKREAVEVAPKRGPGRPRKVRKTAAEEPDAVIEALQNIPDDHQAYDARLRLRHRKRKFEDTVEQPEGANAQQLCQMTEKWLN